MSLVTRAVLRQLWATPSQALGLVVLVALGVAVYAGTGMGLDRIEDSTAALYDELHLLDLALAVRPMPRERAPTPQQLLDAVPGLKGATWRVLAPGSLTLDGGAPIAAMVLAQPSDAEVSGARVVAGAWPHGADEVLIDVVFAEERGLEPGDVLSLRLGSADRTVRISGLGIHPEFLLASVDDHFTMPIKGSAALVIVDDAAQVGQLVVTLRPGVDRDDARRRLVGALGSRGIVVGAARWRENLYSVSCNASRLHLFRDFLPAALAILDGMAALLALLLVRRLARASREPIGTLLAMGHGRGRVLLGWLGALAVVLGLGAGLGAVASVPWALALSRLYADTLGFPALVPVLRAAPVLQATAAVGLLLVVSALPLWAVLRAPAVELLRQEVSEPWRWPRLSLPGRWTTQLGLRNTVSRGVPFLVSVSSVAGALVIAAGMGLFADAQDRNLARYLAARRWDALVQLSHPIAADQVGALLSDARDFEPLRLAPATLGDDRPLDLQLVGHPAPSRLLGDEWLVRGRGLSDDDAAEIVLPMRAARALDVDLGEVVGVHLGSARVELEVVGIVNGWTLDQAYMPTSTLADTIGDDRVGGVLVRAGPAVLEALARDRAVARVVPGADVARAALDANSALTRVMRWYGVLGGLTAVVLAIAALRTAVAERSEEYAVLRAYGVSLADLARGLVVEALTIGIVAACVAGPAVWAVTTVFQARVRRVGIEVPLELSAVGVVAVLVPPVLLLLVAVGPALLRIRSLVLPDELGRRH